MSGPLVELLDLIARWVHVLAGIMWVGNSLLFNWLDRNLRARGDADVYGDIWLIHSGGFYLVEKNKGERTPAGTRALPRPLHWFKWQAYTTWLSGAALLVVVYYVGGRALLVDPAVADLTHANGALIAAGTIALAFVAYETIWRSIGSRSAAAAGMLSIVLLVAAIELLLASLNARAAFIHAGALLGTLMAGNVAFTIMPSQRELVAALERGREPSQAIADRAKTRSIHNNYLTFPVIVLMLSAHFPSLYAQRRADVALVALIAIGALVRHLLNIRFTYARWKPALAAALLAGGAVLAMAIGVIPGMRPRAAVDAAAPIDGRADVAFDDARRVIDRRCASCHSAAPSDVSLGATPAGVAFDSPQQIAALAERIRERVVATRTMPPGNKTRMTEAERQLLSRWIERGAALK
jgi:uncharacterized membrane protein